MASSSVLTCQRTIPAEQTKHTARDRIMVNQGLLPIPDPSLKNNKKYEKYFGNLGYFFDKLLLQMKYFSFFQLLLGSTQKWRFCQHLAYLSIADIRLRIALGLLTQSSKTSENDAKKRRNGNLILESNLLNRNQALHNTTVGKINGFQDIFQNFSWPNFCPILSFGVKFK